MLNQKLVIVKRISFNYGKVKFYIGGPSTNLRVNRFYNCHNITSIYNPHNNNNNNQDIDDNRPVKPKPVDRGQVSNL